MFSGVMRIKSCSNFFSETRPCTLGAPGFWSTIAAILPFCTACFTGHYPVELPDETVVRIDALVQRRDKPVDVALGLVRKALLSLADHGSAEPAPRPADPLAGTPA